MAWTGDPPCQVRFTERDGRWVLTGLRVESDDRLDTNLVRKIPLGRLEELYNVEGSFSPVISGSGDGGARPTPRPRVRVPQGRDYGDDFSTWKWRPCTRRCWPWGSRRPPRSLRTPACPSRRPIVGSENAGCGICCRRRGEDGSREQTTIRHG